MLLALAIVGGLAFIWVLWAFVHALRRGRSFRQSFLYLPLKVAYQVRDGSSAPMASPPPVIYAILHQSRLDPALMLSLLPSDTLHILDEHSARSIWLEPWRDMARTIAFNATHVFVSRRLVRVLKGRGRLAVYLPDGIEPDTRAFRLYRAIVRIAQTAGAEIVAVSVRGSRDTMFSDNPEGRRGVFTALKVSALPALSVDDLRARTSSPVNPAAHALYERLLEADGVPA